MAYVFAKGKKIGMEIWVLADDEEGKLRLIIQGLLNSPLHIELNQLLDERYPMGGTYSPERDSLLNAFNVLSYYFFDEKPTVETEGDIGVVPGEPGVIY